ncbi:MAG TPA: amidohydrolase family protein [Pirellulales bacterium]|nr:amidohydrolase family protein [Pirellulales bacterium]
MRCWQMFSTVAMLATLVASQRLAAAAIDADVVLAGGTVFDGSGDDGVPGEVAIRGAKIVAVGTFERGAVERVIDCRGMIVAPGFIDLHTHSDNEIVAPDTRANVNYLTQGCTTIVTGNCGSGPVDVKKYLDQVDAAGAGTNVLHLLPQGSLRREVLGAARRPPSDSELTKMLELAEAAMRDGAWGMSTGLIYVPSVYASTEELVAIASVVGDHGGIYASHIRGEGTELFDAVNEALEIGRRAKTPVHISHFKAAGRNHWGSLRIAADLVEKAQSAGQLVTADQYPYTASSTSLEAVVIPPAAREGGREAMVERLDAAGPGSELYIEIARRVEEAKDGLQIARYKARRDWVGKRLSRIAADEQRPAIDLVYEIERHGGASIVNFSMSEDDVRMAMRLPWVATASDGSAKIPGSDQPHPRSFGTFPRKIGMYAIQEDVMPLGDAIRSASGLPADILGLRDRGYLREGQAADVVVLDPKTFRDHATFDEPFRYSTGVRYSFVNGTPAIFDSVPTGALAGRAVRKLATPASGATE